MKILNRYTILYLLLCMPFVSFAQKKKPATKKTVVIETPVDPRLERMTQNTQRVVFIDSMLVIRDEMLNKFSLTPQAGTVKWQQNGFSYQNEIGTRKIYAKNNRLYTSQLIGGQFVDEEELSGFYQPGVIDSLDCPFLMNDGMTLYFSAKGSESIGGYDIFVTRYNSETHSFLKPENIGMPFNSTGDDLLFVIDEGNNIGYFATTRRQPDGYVCIYRFIPTETRQTYNDRSTEELERLSVIHRIADTWGDGNERREALQRLNNVLPSPVSITSAPTPFVVNDRNVYHDAKEFRSAENADRYRQWLSMQDQLTQLKQSLSEMRNSYSGASVERKELLDRQIRENEKMEEQLRQDIQQLEKAIRYSENQLINQ